MTAENIFALITAIVSAALTGGAVNAWANRRKIGAETSVILDQVNESVFNRADKLIKDQSGRIDSLLARVILLERQEERHMKHRRYLEDIIMLCIGYMKSLQAMLTAAGVEHDDAPPELQEWLDEYYLKRSDKNKE